MNLNPLHWTSGHLIAFVFAAVFGACIGLFYGIGQFDPYTDQRWLWIGLYCVVGALLGAAGGFLRQLLRGEKSN
jgi:hypothetical protein